jgi:hypothetical protein
MAQPIDPAIETAAASESPLQDVLSSDWLNCPFCGDAVTR